MHFLDKHGNKQHILPASLYNFKGQSKWVIDKNSEKSPFLHFEAIIYCIKHFKPFYYNTYLYPLHHQRLHHSSHENPEAATNSRPIGPDHLLARK